MVTRCGVIVTSGVTTRHGVVVTRTSYGVVIKQIGVLVANGVATLNGVKA